MTRINQDKVLEKSLFTKIVKIKEHINPGRCEIKYIN